MKKIISLLMLAGLLFSVSAQAQDAKAKTILDKVSAKFKKAKTMKANFSLSIHDASGKARSMKKGTFLMKGNRYKIDLGAQQIICDAKSVWTYMPANKEVQVSTFNPDEQTISPAKLFSGSYTKEYKYAYSGQRTIAGKKVDVIELTPNEHGKSFSRVLLYVDPTASMITGGQIYEKNGGSYTYSISNVKSNTTMSDSEFTFSADAHQGGEVIDLR
jgi:outer membrane lipoprotein-sorting protein